MRISSSRIIGGAMAVAMPFLSIPVFAATGAHHVTITYMYWGTAGENKANLALIQSFERANPNITVQPIYVPGTNYNAKMLTMIAAHNAPNVAYDNFSPQKLALKGKIINLSQYYQKYPSLTQRLPVTYYDYAPNKMAATNTGVEIMDLFYNPAAFKKAHIAPPPTNPKQAWSWAHFVHVAEALTVGSSGLHPYQKGFNPQHIRQYGAYIGSGMLDWYSFLRSAGAHIANSAGTKYAMDSPAAVTAFQKLRDLIWKYHVSPDPAVASSLPQTSVLIQSGLSAMVVDGHWNALNFSQAHYKVGVAVLPKINQPVTTELGGPTVLFKSSPLKEQAALKFYQFSYNVKQTLMFRNGLWMPLQSNYYTQPKLIHEWTADRYAYPAGFQQSVVNYTLHYSVPYPEYSLKNFNQINTIISQKLSLIYENKQSTKQVLVAIGKQVQPLLKGRWPTGVPQVR